MLIGSQLHDVVRRTPVDLTRGLVQALVDGEALFTDLGLEFQLWCIPCRRLTQDYICGGGYDRGTYSVTCGCRGRTYPGDDVSPRRSTKGDPKPRIIIPDAKDTVTLDRAQMSVLDTFEAACQALQLQYCLRCLRCRLEDADSDGVTGVKESTANRVVMECACQIRTYQGADAPATNP